LGIEIEGKEVQSEKALVPIDLTDVGIVIEIKELHLEKAWSPIVEIEVPPSVILEIWE